MKTLTFIALVQNKDKCIVYLKDGTTKVFSNDNPIVEKLIATLPQIALHGSATIEIGEEEYIENSLINFFKNNDLEFFVTLKDTVKELLADEVVLDAIVKIAKKYFGEPVDEKSTVIAITKDNESVVGVEKLTKHFSHAMKTGNPIGLTNLIKRLGKIKRNHTVEDVLKFLEDSDLPIADNGDIIAYKLLDREGDHFVDCHTHNIKQHVGSYVFMSEKLVDPDRSIECSCGLHIARRDYLRSFNGDVCVLVYVHPEDIIAVPHGDTRKVRVCAYHIIAELSPKLKELVMSNKPMTSEPEGEELLRKAIVGDYPDATDRTEITKQMGEGVIYSKVNKSSKKKSVRKVTSKEKKALDDNSLSKEEQKKFLTEAMTYESPKKALMTLVQKPKLTQEEARLILAFHKRMKKGWNALGISPDKVDQIIKAAQ